MFSNLPIPERSVRRPIKAKVIFNPASGRNLEAPALLSDILMLLQSWQIAPEVYMVHPDSRLNLVVNHAIHDGIKLIIVCGGDGTIDSVMGALVETDATLGIVPIGTQNNVARSLGIPIGDLPKAVEILRRGRRMKIDVGQVAVGHHQGWFLEACSVGLLTALYPAADEIQHGNLVRIGDFLATLVTSSLSEMKLVVEPNHQTMTTQAHMALISNMPYVGVQFQAAPDISVTDSLLDVFLYSQLTKLELLGYAIQTVGGGPTDPRIQHFRVSSATIQTEPKMPVMADGVMLGEGTMHVSVRRHGLAVMAGAGLESSLVSRAAADNEAESNEE